ncbi:hypothetical protein CWU58_23810 [Salmonella enterica]|uniref:Fimbrial protein n=1 Tax=Salmonella enterica TaxID=28901 RepID=A0A744FCL4_SALER|nr:hypothetical protein [Salmonella enterica]HAF2529853.1 hypothetical protein [Salmonella enterica]
MKTRDDRTAFALSRSLNMLLIVCCLAVSGYARAVVWDDITQGCTDWNGNNAGASLSLPSSVSFEPGKLPDVGKVLYTSPNWYEVNYKCKNTTPGAKAALMSLGHLNPLTDALKLAGLELKILIEGEPGWVPGGATDHQDFGSAYTGETGNKTLRLKLQLIVTQKVTSGFYVVPGLVSFKVTADSRSVTSAGIQFTTPSVRIQYVPTCFVKTSLGTNNVNFGPVITSDVDSSLSRSISFNVTASADLGEKCGKVLKGNYDVKVGSITKSFYLLLPLRVSFILNSGGEISATDGNKSVLLYKKDTHTKNGLKLQITDSSNGNTPVTFGEISLPGSLSANKFGEFKGDGSGTWNIENTYYAILSQSGEEVLTGEYNAQVTVKVDYY